MAQDLETFAQERRMRSYHLRQMGQFPVTAMRCTMAESPRRSTRLVHLGSYGRERERRPDVQEHYTRKGFCIAASVNLQHARASNDMVIASVVRLGMMCRNSTD
jgi:hypothetical protein